MKLSRALRFTVIFSLVCLAITLFVLYAQRNAVQTYEKNLPLARVSDHVKSNVNEAARHHRSFVYLNDRTVDVSQQVAAPLQYCQSLLKAAYNGSSSSIGKFASIEDEDTRALLKESEIAIEQLAIVLSKQHENTIQGTEPDETDLANYTAAVSAALSSVNKLDTRVQTLVERDGKTISSFIWIALLVLIGGLTALIFANYRLQQKSEKVIEQNALKLNEEVRRVSTLSQFIDGVSSGNYDMELKAENEADNLTATLVNMRDKLRKNADDDRKRNWATTGQAQIGEILRANMKAADLYDNIIRFLVKYTKSNQGGLFLLNDENEQQKYLELVACYAFERKKYLTKKVEIGDGLVGQCYLEGQTINLIEIPSNYISITSGLGGANPSSLLIVPMKVNDQIYGVIELASFKKYEDFEIELVEKLAESIASTISNVRVNETTRTLLEKTRPPQAEFE